MKNQATPRDKRIGRSREFREDGIALFVVRPASIGVGTVSATTVLGLSASAKEITEAYTSLEDSLRGAV